MILQPVGLLTSGTAAGYAFRDLTDIQGLFVADNSEGFTLYQTDTCTTAVASDMDPIGSCCHATMPNLTQGTAGLKPAWRDAANGINGHPTASCDSDWMSTASVISETSTGAFTLFAVFTLTSVAANRGICCAGNLSGNYRAMTAEFVTGYLSYRASASAILSATYAVGDGSPHAAVIYGTYASGSNYDVHIWADGSQRANSTVTHGAFTSYPFYAGNGGGYLMVGEIAVCGYCHTELSGDELTGLQSALMTMAGL